MVTPSYTDVLKHILLEHAQHKPSHGKIDVFPVFDDEREIYCIVDAGWNQGGRVHAMIFLARIVDGKVRLEWDGLHYGITDELIQAGVPKEDIVHAWMEPCPPEAARPRKKRDSADAPAPVTN
jgi:hypothetical protein